MLSGFIVTCERWDGCSGLGVNVVLESVRLSWNNHRDRLHQVLRIDMLDFRLIQYVTLVACSL